MSDVVIVSFAVVDLGWSGDILVTAYGFLYNYCTVYAVRTLSTSMRLQIACPHFLFSCY